MNKQSSATNSNANSRMMADGSLLCVALIWGINIPIMKIGLDQIDDLVFNAIRLTISALILSWLAWRERAKKNVALHSFPKGQIFVYSLLMSGLYQICFLLGVSRTTSGNTALIIATIPVWTALMARVFISERISKFAWTGLVVALIGTLVVALQNDNVTAQTDHLLGNLLILLCAITWSLGTVYSRPLLKRISPLQLSSTAALMSLPLHLLIAAPMIGNVGSALSSPNVWLIILYAGLLSSGLAMPMWNFGVRNAGAAHASIIQNLIPLIAIVAAWITRAEPITTGQIIGGCLILGGLAIMRLR